MDKIKKKKGISSGGEEDGRGMRDRWRKEGWMDGGYVHRRMQEGRADG